MSKRFITLLFGLVCYFPSNGQVAIQTDMQNIVYSGLNNPLTIAVAGYKANEIQMTASNGIISKGQKAGHYELRNAKAGLTVIYAKTKAANGKVITIDSVVFRVNKVPLFVGLGSRRSGFYPKAELCRQRALVAVVDGLDFEARCKVLQYSVTGYSDNKKLFTRTVIEHKNGAMIDSTTHTFFTQLNNNDEVVFKNIVIADIDGETRIVPPLEYIITGAEQFKKGQKIIDPITGEER